jgi:phage shock protein A
MSVARRITMLFRIKANKALDRAEDPREVLGYSYQRQVEMLAQVRRGVADVATSRNASNCRPHNCSHRSTSWPRRPSPSFHPSLIN